MISQLTEIMIQNCEGIAGITCSAILKGYSANDKMAYIEIFFLINLYTEHNLLSISVSLNNSMGFFVCLLLDPIQNNSFYFAHGILQ